MNKIFKTLKNRRTGASTAVSELQTGHTKGSGAKATVVAAAVLAALMSAGTAEAARWWTGAPINLHLDDDGGTPHVGTATGFAFGNTNLNLAAKTYSENVTVWNVHDYVFQFGGLGEEGAPTVTLDLDDKANTRSLFEQSGGFEQALVHTTGLTVLPGPRFSVNTMNGIDSNVFEQFVEQNNQKVALGRYLIGERAVNLGNLDGRTWDDFNNKGIRYDSTTFYTAAVLSELEVYGGQTLSLDVSGEQKWGAHLTGEGGVSYVGDNKTEDVVTIKQLYETNGIVSG